jgi:ribose 5-phosphate isomerase B
MERERIREEVRAVVLEKLGPVKPAEAKHPGPRPLVTQADVLRARTGDKTLAVLPGTIVTPLAAETAARLGVEIRERTKAPRVVVAIAADHGGFALKQVLKPAIVELGFDVTDLGTHDASPVDYPDFAHAAAETVAAKRAAFAVVIDSVGVGSAMAANRHRGVRAAPCSTTLQAQSAREHNDANVLTLGGRHVGEDVAKALVKVFLSTAFAGGRHAPRVTKIDGGAS